MEYRLREIAALCGGTLHGADRTVSEVCVDSRTAFSSAGVLFVALRGERRDGHDFLAAMAGRGVGAFLVERLPDPLPSGAGVVLVADTLGALQALAAGHRSRFGGTVVAITGSNGKTVVKEWAAQCAPPGMKLFRSPRSYNSQVGVALSLLMLDGDERVALIEAGISQPGEMERLERMIRPDIGLVTMLGDAHQEHFDSLRHKAEQKALLMRGCRTVIYEGRSPEIGAALERFAPAAARIDSSRFEHGIRYTDQASRRNAASVLALWEALGVPACDTRARLAEAAPLALRLELKEGINDSLLVADCYSSDINSLAIAIDRLSSIAGTRARTLILSDIHQSGLPQEQLYARVAQLVARAGIEEFVGVGPHIAAHAPLFGPRASFYPTTASCIEGLRREQIASHAILLKGSRDFRFEQLSHALERFSHSTVLEVDLDAMTRNLNRYRSRLRAGTRLTAMVKAAGYGAGAYETAALLQHEGVDYLAVAFADEGVQLRERGITMPILVLNADAGSFSLMVANRLEPEIYSFRALEEFAATVRSHAERRYPVHLKIDTGMHRLGFDDADAAEICRSLEAHGDTLRAASVFSHLAAADDPAQDDFTREQIARFERASGLIARRLRYPVLRHIAATAAITRFPEAHFDMCRLGIGLYGFDDLCQEGLTPVSCLRTRIVQIRELDASQRVGYGRAGVLDRPTRAATVPIGYADGLDRRLGCGRWSMLVAGQSAPILGRISMDSCVIDVSGIEGVKEGDQALVFSALPGNRADEMARVLETIPYEVLSRISSRVKRIYLRR